MNKIVDFFKNIKLPALQFKQLKRPGIGTIIFWLITVVLAIVSFNLVRGAATCMTTLNLPGVAPSNCSGGGQVSILGTPQLNAQGTPINPVEALPTPNIAAPEAAYAQWDGASRVNILFIGVDYRDYLTNEGPPRSDTMILFTIDPVTKTAGMLSIPRDLWVNIPGFGYSRINTAYASGEGNKLPGGGPGLTVKTVEQLLGVPINYFGQIDFHAFEEVIDTMGGLYICIPQRIRIDPIGNKPPKNLHAGCQTLWGYEVLAYARQRYTQNGDVDRAKRQQLVIKALFTQVFSPENFPHMMQIAPDIYAEAQAGLRTNMSFEEALKLGALLQQIPLTSIKSGVIDETMTTSANTVLGGQDAAVLKPLMDKITVLRDDIFSGGAISPMGTGDPVTLMQADGARVRVLNGSFTQGLDQRTGNYLLSKGVQVTEIGPADRTYDQTLIIMYNPKLYTYRYLISEFGIAANAQIIIKPEPGSTVDIEIRLGNDWASRIPAGF